MLLVKSCRLHRYLLNQNLLTVSLTHKNHLLRRCRRFATSVFISCTLARKQMSASQPLVFVCELQKRKHSVFFVSKRKGSALPSVHTLPHACCNFQALFSKVRKKIYLHSYFLLKLRSILKGITDFLTHAEICISKWIETDGL